MSNLKTSLSQIWVICHLLPFVRVGQKCGTFLHPLTCLIESVHSLEEHDGLIHRVLTPQMAARRATRVEVVELCEIILYHENREIFHS